MCLHTTVYVSSGRYQIQNRGIYYVPSYFRVCPQDDIKYKTEVSTMCPHTTVYVSDIKYKTEVSTMCLHTTVYVSSGRYQIQNRGIYYVSSYYYICVLILHVSLYYCIVVLVLPHMCPHTTTYVSSCYYYICPHTAYILILLRMCLHTTILCVVILLCMCPHTTICVLILSICSRTIIIHASHTTVHVSSYYYTCVLILLHVSSYNNMCSHTTMCPYTIIYVSSY
jgi:hypothetical protein